MPRPRNLPAAPARQVPAFVQGKGKATHGSKKRSASAEPSVRHNREGTTSKAKAESAVCRPPRRTREAPEFIMEAHEVRLGDELDVDWTLSSDWAEEQ